jgi:hypothetical protein
MRYAMRVGCLCLGVSVLGCGSTRAAAPSDEERPVGASASEGGGAEIDTGQWAPLAGTRRSDAERRRLYEQVATDLGLERRAAPVTRRLEPDAVGGSGRAGERRTCAEVLAADEPAAVVSGTLSYARQGVLTLEVPGREPLKLRADASTCAVQAHRAIALDSLLVGTETQVAYVVEEGLPTARLVRAQPVRPSH